MKTRSGADEGGLKEVFYRVFDGCIDRGRSRDNYFRAHKDGDAVRRKGMG